MEHDPDEATIRLVKVVANKDRHPQTTSTSNPLKKQWKEEHSK